MTKNQIVGAIITAVILLSLGGFTWYSKNNNSWILQTTGNVQGGTLNNTESIVATSSPKVSYLVKTLYKEGNNVVNYIQIDKGVSVEIQNKINKVLKPLSCFEEYNEGETSNLLWLRETLINRYSEISQKPSFTKDDIMSMDRESVRKILLSEEFFEENIQQEVLLLNENIFSVKQTLSNSCGGAYPNSGVEVAYNFDLQTGNEIGFKDIFVDFEKNRKEIEALVLKVESEKYGEQDKECIPPEYVDLGLSLSSALTEEGVTIVSLGYIHALQACEPGEITVPYITLKQYLNTELPFIKSMLNSKDQNKNTSIIRQNDIFSEQDVIGTWRPKDNLPGTPQSQFLLNSGAHTYKEFSSGKVICEGGWSFDNGAIQTRCVNRVAGQDDFTITLQATFDKKTQELTFIDEGQESIFIKVK